MQLAEQENSSLSTPRSSLLNELTHKFHRLMKALYHQRGAQMDIHILEQEEAQSFIQTHAHILDSTFQKVEMTDRMRDRLTRSNYIFSGLKTFHELNEAFPSLLDENGDRKPFERFLNDVRRIDETYNRNYLRAEYGFVQASAQMAAKWEQYSEDGDRYLLQYRTQHDDRVRPEHAALDRITLPMSDPFWESYYPPNGWNCRCTVVQVRRGKYPETPHRDAMDRGDEALNGERYSIFRFNSGKQEKTVPDYNPYTIKRCNDCDVAKGGSVKLASFTPDNEVCAACKLLRACENNRHTKAFYSYRTEATNEAAKWTKQNEKLRTGNYYQTKKSFKRAISHARSIEQMEIYSNIKQYLSSLNFVKTSQLGETKNLTSPKDAANVERKRDRGVTSYNVYELSIDNHTWIVKTEVYKGRTETIYCLYPKE